MFNSNTLSGIHNQSTVFRHAFSNAFPIKRNVLGTNRNVMGTHAFRMHQTGLDGIWEVGS